MFSQEHKTDEVLTCNEGADCAVLEAMLAEENFEAALELVNSNVSGQTRNAEVTAATSPVAAVVATRRHRAPMEPSATRISASATEATARE